MRKRRLKIRLADMSALMLASLLLAVDLMVRDPQPIAAVAPQGGIALTITLIFMAFGLCMAFYGLYHERRKVWAHVRHWLKIRLRFARREVHYHSGLRRLARFQLGFTQPGR